MGYQVLGRPTKDVEFEKYVDALQELKLPTERDAHGRVGVIDDKATAEQILAKVREKIPYMTWQIHELPHTRRR